ncbi:MAG TPA: hypothetical protein VEV37_08910 [Bryobacteraceae bacterium]|nr:hypothetical protein [Bryobacteraceae bacterium]
MTKGVSVSSLPVGVKKVNLRLLTDQEFDVTRLCEASVLIEEETLV